MLTAISSSQQGKDFGFDCFGTKFYRQKKDSERLEDKYPEGGGFWLGSTKRLMLVEKGWSGHWKVDTMNVLLTRGTVSRIPG